MKHFIMYCDLGELLQRAHDHHTEQTDTEQTEICVLLQAHNHRRDYGMYSVHLLTVGYLDGDVAHLLHALMGETVNYGHGLFSPKNAKEIVENFRDVADQVAELVRRQGFRVRKAAIATPERYAAVQGNLDPYIVFDPHRGRWLPTEDVETADETADEPASAETASAFPSAADGAS